MKIHRGQMPVRLSVPVREVISRMVGTAASCKPSSSAAINSIIMRYECMLPIVEQTVSRKYDQDEIRAICAWLKCIDEPHDTLLRLDRVKHLPEMISHIVTGSEICTDVYLDKRRKNALLEIVRNKFSTADMIVISDMVIKDLTCVKVAIKDE